MFSPFAPLAEDPDHRRMQFDALLQLDKRAREAVSVGKLFSTLEEVEAAVKLVSRVWARHGVVAKTVVPVPCVNAQLRGHSRTQCACV